jgi:hypothetical protein
MNPLSSFSLKKTMAGEKKNYQAINQCLIRAVQCSAGREQCVRASDGSKAAAGVAPDSNGIGWCCVRSMVTAQRARILTPDP